MASQIGWIEGMPLPRPHKRVVGNCCQDKIAAVNGAGVQPLYRENVEPYMQTCHICGRTIVERTEPDYDELYQLPN